MAGEQQQQDHTTLTSPYGLPSPSSPPFSLRRRPPADAGHAAVALLQERMRRGLASEELQQEDAQRVDAASGGGSRR